MKNYWKPFILILIIMMALWVAKRPRGPQLDKAKIREGGVARAEAMIPCLSPRAKLAVLLYPSGAPADKIRNKAFLKSLKKKGYSIEAVMQHQSENETEDNLLIEEGLVMGRHFFEMHKAYPHLDVIISTAGLPSFETLSDWSETNPKIVVANLSEDQIETAQNLVKKKVIHAALLPDEDSGVILIKQ